jgi:GDPmannose 4,6-dehydratase
MGVQDCVSLGNVQSTRDWGFAGDYVKAMHLMLQQDEPDDYIIATGETHSVGELLDAAFRVVGIDDWKPYVRFDAALMRPAEVDQLTGDAGKARTVLGWKPTVSFEELIDMMVRHDVERLRSERAMPDSR